MEIPFGKYKHMSIEDVCASDPQYAQWFANACYDMCPEVCDAIALTIKLDAYYLCFGKYRGRTIDEVYAINPAYIEFIASKPNLLDTIRGLREAIEKVRAV